MLKCANCGSSEFVTPQNASNASIVTCQSCSAALATVSELQAAAKAAIAAGSGKVVKENFREAFRNLPNIRVD
ncbi:MAG TPA: hypothetical protein VIH97_05000 [Candidatus Acidoferrales bacterium]|jgi:hypothetical protein